MNSTGHPPDTDQHPPRARRPRWLIPASLVIAWLVLGGIGGPFTGKLAEVAENDSSTFLPASAEATKVEELRRRFSGGQRVPAFVVAERAEGITDSDRRYLTRASERIASVEGVERVSPPIPSPGDDQALRVVVSIDSGAEPADSVSAMRTVLERPPPGLTTLVSGPAAQAADLSEAFSGVDGLLLLVAGGVVLLILVLVYRSPLLPVLVLLSAVFALGAASLAVYFLAVGDVLALNGQSQGILFILVVGAATDYALLLVSRFREELRAAPDKYRALARSWRATLEPILASAGTVILGLLCLLFSDLNSNRSLGPVAAIGIAAALLASTTFLPAVLALFGRAAFWPFPPVSAARGSTRRGGGEPRTSDNRRTGAWECVATWVGRAPRAIWIGSTVLLLLGTLGLPQLRADGTARSEVFLTPVESVAGQELLSEHFPGGAGAPTVIIAEADSAERVTRAAEVAGVADVAVTRTETGEPRVVDGLVRVEAVLTDPADSEAALTTVRRIRESVHAVEGADALVGGTSAIQLDTRLTAERDRSVIIPIVLLVILAVLALLLRALVAPLVLLATVVLSFAATMGVSALVFNHVLDMPGADPVVPLYGFVFLVALGIDYNIFLMTRAREEVRRSEHRTGVLRGLSVTGGVITSAGVVLAATFAALAVLPILFLAQLAFIVAFGVLLDTLIVRSLLVPALSLDIGRVTWWPARLGRRKG
ncbi:putative drug exporter of the RND superfamily [Actinopolyspora xinjiangensis]|uniref:Putative drug exporter of the RND superfamily n=1 Tax=Actinopolyspora xinjiangensis TaxID=405564 RepID=A0A1H0QDM9_9ACTN|nr:MMPL family transporter [Actinopolyspora xinjiangensis]SDP15462.1 putative drug exporter of the RND superfamily [Actinopolyspora xinjiangensis]